MVDSGLVWLVDVERRQAVGGFYGVVDVSGLAAGASVGAFTRASSALVGDTTTNAITATATATATATTTTATIIVINGEFGGVGEGIFTDGNTS